MTGNSSNSRPWQKSPVLWVVALLIVAGGITILTSDGDDSPRQSATAAQVVGEVAVADLIGQSLPSYATPDPAIGLQAPAISGQDFFGNTITLDNDGTPRLYAFFAHWCPHCQTDLPMTADWINNNDLDGVEVVAVSTGVTEGAENYPPSDWFAKEEWPATVLADTSDSAIASGFGLTAFPYWVAVDADGAVVARLTGVLSDTQIEALVGELSRTS